MNMILDPQEQATRFLWPAWSRKDENADLHFKTTGYEKGCHWTGEIHVAAQASDYKFWSWVFLNRLLLPPILNDTFLPNLERFYEAWLGNARDLVAPNDACYVVDANSNVNGTGIVAAMKERFGENSVVTLTLADLQRPTFQLFAPFCRGLVEVFCFMNQQCDYFGALAENMAELEQNLRLIEKRVHKLRDRPKN